MGTGRHKIPVVTLQCTNSLLWWSNKFSAAVEQLMCFCMVISFWISLYLMTNVLVKVYFCACTC